MNNNKFSASSQAVASSVGRSVPERSEGERRTADDATAGAGKPPQPDPEVVAQAKRRRFTADYKQRPKTVLPLAKLERCCVVKGCIPLC